MSTSPKTHRRCREPKAPRAPVVAWLVAALAGVAEALLGSLLTGNAMAAGAPLECRLSVPAEVVVGRPVMLDMALTNPGRRPVHVLTWGTAFEPAWFAPWVDVSRGDAPLAYGGAQVKRDDPSARQYLTIGPGATRRAAIDLAPVFDLAVPGRYRVQPQVRLHDLVVGDHPGTPRPRARTAPRDLACNEVGFTVVP